MASREELVRDFAGRRVRMTYHRRDPGYGHVLGLQQGQQGPFDCDEVAEGQLVPVVCFVPERLYLWGVQSDSGEIAFAFLRPTDSAVEETNHHTASQWDGKRNGTYQIKTV